MGGPITQFVDAVVTVVENATGNQNSDAGNAVQQQAANVENTVDEAGKAASQAASDAGAFIALVGNHARDGLGQWLFGNMEANGMQMPDRFSLSEIARLVVSVIGVAAGNLESKAKAIFGSKAVAVAEEGVGLAGSLVQGGPAALWREVKDGTRAGRDEAGSIAIPILQRTATRIGNMFGIPSSAPPANQPSEQPSARAIKQIARRADVERRKMVAELRRAVQFMEVRQRGAVPGASKLRGTYSSTPEGIELGRLSAMLSAAAANGMPTMSRDAARHLAAAIAAAAQSAALHAELLQWLAAIKRLAGRARVAPAIRGPQPGKPFVRPRLG